MMNKKIIRVFPRRTNATPDDQDVRVATTPTLWDEADEVHISVTFTWDIPWATMYDGCFPWRGTFKQAKELKIKLLERYS